MLGHFGGMLSMRLRAGAGPCFCFELKMGKGREVSGARFVHERRWCIQKPVSLCDTAGL
ncbi:hypothetical protein E2C01_052144 [Portunus trituberculatus]|uniref:Uncharacterized protein n=1 Tax=Portunus trituberculatus TaxID=210409 RepID=A0A5B7GKT7_PORTR|nr:hypothetical protein [Portunus trituberculatus]